MKSTIIILAAGLMLLFYQSLFAEGDNLLEIGEPAPVFTLPDASGRMISLTDYHGKKYVVLIFYPGDETPGCTKQLCAARDDYTSFTENNAVLFGVNPGSATSHDKFIKHHNFPFTLLVDEGMKTAAAYGCGGIMVKRTVYAIDPLGKIVFAKRGMPPNSEIIRVIRMIADQELPAIGATESHPAGSGK